MAKTLWSFAILSAIGLKKLEPSHKMYLDFWVVFERKKTHFVAEFQKINVNIFGHSGEEKTLFFVVE